MPGFGDKIKGFFSMDSMYDDSYDDYDDYDKYDDVDDEPVKPVAPKKKVTNRVASNKDYYDDYEVSEKPSFTQRKTAKPSKVVSLRNERNRNIKAEIFTFKPSSMEDSKEIVENLLDGKAIILNFEGTNTDLAQRIIDSVSGACCAVDGTIKKISGYIYIVTPNTIYLDGDFSESSSSGNAFDIRGNRYQY